MEFEVYMEKFQVTKWRDGCVYDTRSLGYGWFPKSVVDANRPVETNIIYAAASGVHQTIRKATT